MTPERPGRRLRRPLAGIALLATLALAGGVLGADSPSAAPAASDQDSPPSPAGHRDNSGTYVPLGVLSMPMKPLPTLTPTERQFERTIEDTKASREVQERMAAALAGRKALYEAGKLTGQAKIDYLEQASRAGDPVATLRLADMLDTGDMVAVDPSRACGYYRAAALAGRGDAALSLGLAYAKGRGVERNYVEGLAWMIVARRRDNPTGIEDQLRVFLRDHGLGTIVGAAEKRAKELLTPRSREDAIAALPPPAPLVIAAEKETVYDARKLGPHAEPDDGPATPPEVVVITIVGAKLTWPSLADLQRAADKGNVPAMDALGHVMVAGKLRAADALGAVVWFERAAAHGDADAAYELTALYSGGGDVVPDDAKAFAYCTQAAQAGVVPAIVNLGVYYTNGRGTARDPMTGLAWLCVAKHFGAPTTQEKKLRTFLTRYRPADVTKAEALAATLIPPIEARLH